LPGLLVLTAAFCSAQSGDRLQFDFTSVRESQLKGAPDKITGGPGTTDPDRMVYGNFSLLHLVSYGYSAKATQTSVASGMVDARFDVTEGAGRHVER